MEMIFTFGASFSIFIVKSFSINLVRIIVFVAVIASPLFNVREQDLVKRDFII